MIDQLTLYITQNEYTTRVQPMLEGTSAQFSTWLKSQGIIVVDFLPQNLRDKLIESRGSTLPIIEVLYTDDRIVRQSGEVVFDLLDDISTAPGQFVVPNDTE